ncbi:MAG: hypothetical protein ACFB21_10480 [Opitutales bacterium]
MFRPLSRIFLLTPLLVCQGQAQSPRGMLLEEVVDYESTEAVQEAFTRYANVEEPSKWKLAPESLTFAGHFPPSGGALLSMPNEGAAIELSEVLQVTGDPGDNQWLGRSFTVYISFLVRSEHFEPWYLGGCGGGLATSSRHDGIGGGIGRKGNKPAPFGPFAIAGGRFRLMPTAGENRFHAEGEVQPGETYLILMRIDYTNPSEAPYNPFSGQGETRVRLACYREGESYPAAEQVVEWDIDATTPNSMRGESLFLDHFTVACGASFADGYLVDDIRVATSFNLVTVPEPAAMSLLLGATIGIFAWRKR